MCAWMQAIPQALLRLQRLTFPTRFTMQTMHTEHAFPLQVLICLPRTTLPPMRTIHEFTKWAAAKHTQYVQYITRYSKTNEPHRMYVRVRYL